MINTLQSEFSPNFSGHGLRRLKSEIVNSYFERGFQLMNLINDTLYGVLEGPISSPYQNWVFFIQNDI